MDFARSGMLGVTVLCIALAGALFGGYLAGVDTIEEPAVDYNYLADVSGLFDYDRSPNYIDFDSSTNYTGYYSADTGRYFPDDRVDFEPYGGVNNYRIEMEPDMTTDTLDVSGSQNTAWVLWYNAYYEGDGIVIETMGTPYVEYHTVRVQHTSVADFLSEYQIAYQGDDKVRIRSASPAGQVAFGESIQKDWVIVTTSSEWYLTNNEAMYYKACSQEYSNARPSDNYYVPCLSCVIDFQTGQVSRYFDSNCEIFKDTVSLDSVILVHGGQTPTIPFNFTIEMAGTAYCDVQDPVPPTYLDPTRGVSLTGA